MLRMGNYCLVFFVESMNSSILAWIIGGSVAGGVLLIVAVTIAVILIKKHV